MVRGVLTALALLLLAGAAHAQPAVMDTPPPPAETMAPPPEPTAPPIETPPAASPATNPAVAIPDTITPAPDTASGFNDDPARFIVGQVWTLKAPAPPDMRVRICGVDELDDGREIVSVTILGPVRPAPGCQTIDIAHMPFEQPTLTAAVDHVVARDAPSDDAFAQGYQYWRDNGRGAAWTVPPLDAARISLEALAQHNAGGAPAP